MDTLYIVIPAYNESEKYQKNDRGMVSRRGEA